MFITRKRGCIRVCESDGLLCIYIPLSIQRKITYVVKGYGFTKWISSFHKHVK